MSLSHRVGIRKDFLRKKAKQNRAVAEALSAPYAELANWCEQEILRLDLRGEIADSNKKIRAKTELKHPAKAGRSAQNRRAKILKIIKETKAHPLFKQMSESEQKRCLLGIILTSRNDELYKREWQRDKKYNKQKPDKK